MLARERRRQRKRERKREREIERERERDTRTRRRGMDKRDKTASDREHGGIRVNQSVRYECTDKTASDPAFLVTGITATPLDSIRSSVPVYGNNGCPSIAQTAKRTRFKRGTSPTPHFTRLIVLNVVDGFIFFRVFYFRLYFVLKERSERVWTF